MNDKDKQRIVILLILGVGILLLGLKGSLEISGYSKEWSYFKNTAVLTEAQIIDIWSYQTRGSASVNVHITYKDNNGVEHSGSLDIRMEGKDEGDSFPIYYDKNNPEKYMVEPNLLYHHAKKVVAVTYIIGALLIVTGIIYARRSTLIS